MSDTTETPDVQMESIDITDIAALAMAIAIWLGQQNTAALDEIGNMADALKEKFVDGE